VNAIARAKEQHRIAPIGSRTRRWIDLRNTVAATLAAELNPDSTSEVPGAGGTIVAARKRQGRVLSGLPAFENSGRDSQTAMRERAGRRMGLTQPERGNERNRNLRTDVQNAGCRRQC
jgi:hypothetical protein